MSFAVVRKLVCCLSGLWLGTTATSPPLSVSQAAERPNIVIVMTDDMGWSDLGCYGGEIQTPNLDGLAAGGVRFTQFYNTARCCPTRAALLTGLYSHQAGIGHMVADLGHPAYRGSLNRSCLTIAEVLRGAGYRTYMAGKWHVSSKERADGGSRDDWPLQRGFDRFYGTITGAGNFFDPVTLCRDNTLITAPSDREYQPETYYYTDAITDHALTFVRDHRRDRPDQPFLLYVAYTAAHWPMHALPDDIAKYRGKYDSGYAAIQKARLAKLRDLNLIDRQMTPAPPTNHWDAVQHRDWEARCMEVYAAMVDRMDQGVGRLVEQLRHTNALDNTLFLYLQDNGGCAEGLGRAAKKSPPVDSIKRLGASEQMPIVFPTRQTRDGRVVRTGPKAMPGPDDTFVAYGQGWANVSNTPFREFKHWQHEGGISSPLIAHWPRGIPEARRGQLEHQPSHLIDVMATCVDLAGAEYPRKGDGASIQPLEGVSLRAAFNGQSLKRSQPIFWEHEGNRAVRDGQWKLVSKHPGDWELYDIDRDRGEQHNLAVEQAERVRSMSAAWHAWARRVGVQPWPIPKYTGGDKRQLERPVSGKLLTRWAKDVSPENVHAEYPRPQLVRPKWQNLNGLWNYAIRPRVLEWPGDFKGQFDGKILVPFPVESTLSQVARFVGAEQSLIYQRTFRVPADWKEQRLLLHFGAVDWEAKVLVNGRVVGEHRGGYDPFTCDITDAIRATNAESSEHEIVVVVWDPTDAGTQPRGKQVAHPNGIWYTPVTGIWQTVWLEPVPATRIGRLSVEPNIDAGELAIGLQTIDVQSRGTEVDRKTNTDKPANGRRPLTMHVTANDDEWKVEGGDQQRLFLKVPGFQAWSPSSPKLYDLAIELRDGERVLDRVESYFGMRKIALGKDLNGTTRILLNNQPLFQFGPLDQGWWPDGLYTAPSDAALRYDLEMTKQFGFNLVRKHVKVEPARWYYHCDRLGLLVWQDMPSGDANAKWPADGTEDRRSPEADVQFGHELKAMIDHRRNDTCIVAWVPFNEAWGQFDTVRWTRYVKDLDRSRLVISASGGNDFGVGDVRDIHFYPQPEAPPAEDHRASVLGEYGGLGLPIAGHTWQDEKNWGYRQFSSQKELQEVYLQYLTQLRPMIESRLSAAIYTQTTDVEVEVNGWMTYDRAVTKLDPAKVSAAHQALYAPLRMLSAEERIQASVLAHWRFEDGTPGQLVPHDRQKADGVAVRDASGHRNHLYAFSERNAPRWSSEVPAATIASWDLPNRGSLDDSASEEGATRDLYTDPGRARTHMDAINTFPLTAWTLEASFRLAASDREQTLVGKDGRPTPHDEAPLQLMIREDNRLAMVAIDRTGTVRTVASRDPIRTGEWRHAAVISDGQTLRLFLSGDNGLELEGETEFVDGLVIHPGTWTIGRGFHKGAIGRDAQAWLDEVRVSTRALPLEGLLWQPR